jgi:hypothetical protein
LRRQGGTNGFVVGEAIREEAEVFNPWYLPSAESGQMVSIHLAIDEGEALLP